MLAARLPLGLFGTRVASPNEHSQPKHVINAETCHGRCRKKHCFLIGLQNKGPNISFENKRYKTYIYLRTKIIKLARPLAKL